MSVSRYTRAPARAARQLFSAVNSTGKAAKVGRSARTAKFRMLAAFILFSALTVAGCGYADIQYAPPFAPVVFSIDTNGTVAVHGDVKIVTPLGEFSIGAGIFKNLESSPNSLIVVIRHKQNGELYDVGYRINSNEQLSVMLDGHIHLTISNSRVFVDASRGQVSDIAINSVNPNPRTSTAGSPAVPASTPAGLFTDPLTPSAHPDGPRFYPVYGYGYASDGFHMYGDVGLNFLDTPPFSDADISVTVTWLHGDPSSEFGVLFRGIYTYWIRGDDSWGVYKDTENLVAPTRNGFIRIGVSRLRIHMKRSHLEFYIDGHKLGSVDDTTSLGGSIGLYAYGVDVVNNEVVFSDLVVKPVSLHGYRRTSPIGR